MSEFKKIINDLTPEQRKELRWQRLPQWLRAVLDTLTDPEFWITLFVRFVEGFLYSLASRQDDDDPWD